VYAGTLPGLPLSSADRMCWNRTVTDSANVLDVAQALYAGSLDDFTTERNAQAARAKTSGDSEAAAEIRSLVKPTAAAWAANLLACAEGRPLGGLDELRQRIAEATADGDRETLRELTRSRHRLISELVARGGELAVSAGRSLSAAASSELSEAIQAALSDEAVAAAMATGRLTRVPTGGGMSVADVRDLVALPPDDLFSTSTADASSDEGRGRTAASSRPPKTPRAGESSRPATKGSSASTAKAASRVSGNSSSTAAHASAERRRRLRAVEDAEKAVAAAAADRAAREEERRDLMENLVELRASVREHRDALFALERKLEDAERVVEARSSAIRARELEWKRADATLRAARRAADNADEA
jgi:hypothetical protein